VAYTETTKHELLGVSRSTLEEFSAVSEQTAAEMAIGVLQRTNSDFSLATTGYAGPSAAMTSAVGRVYVAMARKSDQQISTSVIFLELVCEETEKPCRTQIQEATVKAALELLLANI
jgi:PncC family amidohydrolase